jgi:hypothetical protein
MAESARGSLALTDADAGGARERFLSARTSTKGPVILSGPPAPDCRPHWSERAVRLTGTWLDDAAIVFEQPGALRTLAATRRAT